MFRVNWEDIGNTWRSSRAEYGDYLLLMTGLGKYQFAWAVFHNHREIAASDPKAPLRNSVEAKHCAEAALRAAIYFQPLNTQP